MKTKTSASDETSASVNINDVMLTASAGRTVLRTGNASDYFSGAGNGGEGLSSTRLAAFSTGGVRVTLNSTLIDSYYGRRVAEVVFGDEPNAEVIAYFCRNDEVRAECEKFFLSRKVGAIVTKLLGHLKVLQKARVLTVAEIVSEIRSLKLSPEASTVIAELVIPVFRRAQLVADAGTESIILTYRWEPVTLSALNRELLAVEVLRVAENIKSVELNVEQRATANVLAEELSQAMLPLGRAFGDINMLATVLRDIVYGVRVHIDPNPQIIANVPIEWRDHPVVQVLAKNRVFVDAAMSLPLQTSDSSTPHRLTELYLLDKWAPAVLAALKTSSRYRMVALPELIASWNLKHVVDASDYVRSAFLFQTAAVFPTGMSVVAIEDAVVPGAWSIDDSKEPFAEVIKAAYGDTSTFSVHAAANLLVDATATVVAQLDDGESTGSMQLTILDVGDDLNYGPAAKENADEFDKLLKSRSLFGSEHGAIVGHGFVRDLVCLSARSVQYIPSTDVDALGNALVDCVYEIETDRKRLHPAYIPSGHFMNADTWMTTSLVEAVTMMKAFSSRLAVADRPQLVGSKALRTRIVNFDPKAEFRRVTSRYAFNVDLNGVAARGSFNLNEVTNMRASVHSFLVIPSLNREIMATVSRALIATYTAIEAVKKAGQVTAYATLRRGFIAGLVKMIQGLNPGFRGFIHELMVSRGSAGLTFEDSVRMRARLRSVAFGGYADLYAFYVFLHSQGLDSEAWETLVNDEEVIRQLIITGTERKVAG